MLSYEKDVKINDETFSFKYKIVTGELSCKKDDILIFHQFLWLPYKTFNIKINEKDYKLKTILLPINKCSLYYGKVPICRDLFPRLKRYTLISFTLSTIKKIAIVIALIFT
ncbi:hypothetical protein DIKCMJMK_03916 [Shewanella oneidensis]|uniref:Uncharacterized protein n=1 Tax=Shewanella oneidensis (strain ATCC 700550 / JCM 31522 / CIP 106686 / LMG 19005 / NCIMB 14063 / MR-1) TaxID=211586 RepID=Q8E876_SHEON|nr:hypothetical protein SO_A0047 [Shewanella oneidensis MR-1]MEE2030018.1 hypothetical protein [Shewanella oneidensis]